MKAEVIAQAEISKLGYEEARLSEMKTDLKLRSHNLYNNQLIKKHNLLNLEILEQKSGLLRIHGLIKTL